MSVFNFKHFSVRQFDSAMKVGTDAMLLGSFISSQDSRLALEIGAGTGVISMMIAQKSPCIRIDAVEIDPQSFEECSVNFNNCSWSDALKAHNQDFLSFKSHTKYDLIFSNPPYYQTKLENENRREARAKHERSLPMGPFVQKMSELLSRAGEVWLIIPFSDSDQWIHEFSKYSINLRARIDIRGKSNTQLNRSIIRLSKKKMAVDQSEFIVRNQDGSYTDEYIELTSEYHAKKLR